MKGKTIFETLPNYEKGFFGRAGAVEAAAYRKKSELIKARILSGKEDIADIIIDEQQKVAKALIRARFVDDNGKAALKAQGYWSALEQIQNAMGDSKPLKGAE